MAHLTSAEKRLRSQAAAHSLHAKYDSRELTANARAAADARFEREVDPDGTLPPAERARRAKHARKAYFSKLAYLSAKARRAKRVGDATNGAPNPKGAAAKTTSDAADALASE